MLNEISKLKHNDPGRRGMASFFRARICEPKTRKVYCCDDGSFPSESDLKLLKLEDRIDIRSGATDNDTSVDVKVSTMVIRAGLLSFQVGSTKLDRFLPKNQHTQKKIIEF